MIRKPNHKLAHKNTNTSENCSTILTENPHTHEKQQIRSNSNNKTIAIEWAKGESFSSDGPFSVKLVNDQICPAFLLLFRAPPTNVDGALLFSACPSVCPSVCGHSNSVIFNRISSKFHIWIASTNLSFKFEYGFCPTSEN